MAQLMVEPTTAIPDSFGLKPKVVTGDRVYFASNWARKDSIWFQGQRIGQIVLAHNNRAGTTIALNGRRHPGRAIDWCLQQFLNGRQGQRHRPCPLAA